MRKYIIPLILAGNLAVQIVMLLELREYVRNYRINTDFAIAARNAMRDQLDRIEQRCDP